MGGLPAAAAPDEEPSIGGNPARRRPAAPFRGFGRWLVAEGSWLAEREHREAVVDGGAVEGIQLAGGRTACLGRG